MSKLKYPLICIALGATIMWLVHWFPAPPDFQVTPLLFLALIWLGGLILMAIGLVAVVSTEARLWLEKRINQYKGD